MYFRSSSELPLYSELSIRFVSFSTRSGSGFSSTSSSPFSFPWETLTCARSKVSTGSLGAAIGCDVTWGWDKLDVDCFAVFEVATIVLIDSITGFICWIIRLDGNIRSMTCWYMGRRTECLRIWGASSEKVSFTTGTLPGWCSWKRFSLLDAELNLITKEGTAPLTSIVPGLMGLLFGRSTFFKLMLWRVCTAAVMGFGWGEW